tara:strand:+ start:79718 stop:80515 length:798 start_codon:yes stop_codon:yes gene_type:complete
MGDPTKSGIRYHIAIVILAFFFVGTVVPIVLYQQEWYKDWLRGLPMDVRILVHPAMHMAFAFVGWLTIRWMVKDREQISMGLVMPPMCAAKAFAIGFGCSLALLAFGVFTEANEIRYTLVYSTLLPGVTEEIFFRAFAFGLLMQAARVKLWTAAFTTAIVFGLAHLVRSDVRAMPIGEMISWLAMLSAGGFFFAWIYALAPWNLWVVIALHAGMNLWWDIYFNKDIPPFNGGVTTLARIIPVGIAVYLVVFRGVLRRPSATTIPS